MTHARSISVDSLGQKEEISNVLINAGFIRVHILKMKLIRF